MEKDYQELNQKKKIMLNFDEQHGYCEMVNGYWLPECVSFDNGMDIRTNMYFIIATEQKKRPSAIHFKAKV